MAGRLDAGPSANGLMLAIGICAAVERVRRDPWVEVVTMVQRTYPEAIQRAGAMALILPPDEVAGSEP